VPRKETAHERPFFAIDCLLSPALNLHLPPILLHIFQPSQSNISPFSTFLRFTLIYFLNYPSPWPIRTTYPVYSSLFFFMLLRLDPYVAPLNSWLVLIFHILCSATGLCILLYVSSPMYSVFSYPSQSLRMFHPPNNRDSFTAVLYILILTGLLSSNSD
jgi:hypothetical protein